MADNKNVAGMTAVPGAHPTEHHEHHHHHHHQHQPLEGYGGVHNAPITNAGFTTHPIPAHEHDGEERKPKQPVYSPHSAPVTATGFTTNKAEGL